MKNDMKKRILSAQLALILLLMLWCGTYFETKESQRQMEQLEASQSESGVSNAVEVKRKLMYKAMHTPLGKYPETVTYTLGKIAGANNSNLPVGNTYENNAYTRYLKKILNIQNEDVFEESENAKPAVYYAVAYLYEHREEADHHALTLTLRSLLFGSRKEAF